MPEYATWMGIKRRCNIPTCSHYKSYGGRGIKVCDKWINSFDDFYTDMGNRPSNYHSIDRINVDGDYEPSNCRWATRYEQSINKRNTRYETIDGVKKPLLEWCKQYNISIKSVLSRLNYGLSLKDALTIPLVINKFQVGHKRMYNKRYIKYDIGIDSKTMFEWCKMYGVDYELVYNRVKILGYDILTALTKKVDKKGVYVYLNGVYVDFYTTQREASIKTNVDVSTINDILKGRQQKTRNGYVFKYNG